MFGYLISVAIGLLLYFDTRSGINLHYNITSQYYHQEAIQFQAADDAVGYEHALDSNREPPFRRAKR